MSSMDAFLFCGTGRNISTPTRPAARVQGRSSPPAVQCHHCGGNAHFPTSPRLRPGRTFGRAAHAGPCAQRCDDIVRALTRARRRACGPFALAAATSEPASSSAQPPEKPTHNLNGADSADNQASSSQGRRTSASQTNSHGDNTTHSGMTPAQPMRVGSELVFEGVESAWAALNAELHYLPAKRRPRVRSALVKAANAIVDARNSTELTSLLLTMSILASLHADETTLEAAAVLSTIRSGAMSDVDFARVERRDTVGAVVEDALWLDNLPNSLRDLDDDLARLLREYVITAFHDSRAMLIQLATTLHTMRTLDSQPLYRRHVLALQCLQVYVPLAHTVGIGALMWELEDLAFRELFPTSYAAVERWHTHLWARSQKVLGQARGKVLSELQHNEYLAERVKGYNVMGRTKNLFSTFKKILRDNKRQEDVLDIVAMRVVIRMKEEYQGVTEIAKECCLEVYRVVAGLWREIEGRYKDYVSKPKSNGYMSVHTTVHHPNGLPLEIQVRTEEMHQWAEHGSAGHSFYKGGLADAEEVRRFAESMRREHMLLLQMQSEDPAAAVAAATAAAVSATTSEGGQTNPRAAVEPGAYSSPPLLSAADKTKDDPNATPPTSPLSDSDVDPPPRQCCT